MKTRFDEPGRKVRLKSLSAEPPARMTEERAARRFDAVAKEFAVFYQKKDAAPGGGYMVDHSRVAYLMDPQGKPLALLPEEKSGQAVADEARRWVK